MAPRVIAIAAMDEGRVIGINNRLPWNIPEDLVRFRQLTLGHSVLMGRKTWESLPASVRPLPRRTNIVVSRDPDALMPHQNLIVWRALEDSLHEFRQGKLALPSDTLWIVGGAQIYHLSLPYWDEVYLTLVDGKHEGDVFFPPFEAFFEKAEEERREGFSYIRYLRSAGALKSR